MQRFLVIGLLKSLGALPFSWLQALGRGIGRLMYRLDGRNAHNANVNVALCFPELSAEAQAALARQSLIETGQTYAEMIKIWTHPRHDWNALVDDGGCMAWGCSHLKTGRGGIMALPHLGNWEIGARLLESLNTPVTVLYRPPRQPYLEDFLVQRRRNRILRPVPVDLSGIREAEAALQRNEIVMIIADQVPKKWKSSGVIAPFFGQPAVTMKLINRLARRHKVPVAFYYIYRTAQTPPYKAACFLAEPEIASDDPQEAAVALNHSLERCIRAHPEQYQWVYRRFVKAGAEMENPYHRH